MDGLDDFDDELEELSWSWRYVSVCLLIPTLNGFINGYCWAGLSLHYREMGWSIARVGTPSTYGFILRMVCQKIRAIWILGHDSIWPNPPDPHDDWSHLL